MMALELSQLDDPALMALRDECDSLPRPWRELAVLAACCDQSLVSLARLPLGERDHLLLRVRRSVFGSRVDAEGRCDHCGERLDLSFDVNDLLDTDLAGNLPGAGDKAASIAHGPRLCDFERNGVTLCVRAPDTEDVAAAAAAPDPELAVLMRCIEPSDDRSSELLQDGRVREAIAARLAEIDPRAELTLTTVCPRCAEPCATAFDPAGFLLAEITAYADRLIDEVDQLARVYGWSESDILALGARRRRRYLELTS